VDETMLMVGGRIVMYFPVFAVWIVLVGAMINRDRAVIVVPLVIGAVVGVGAVAFDNFWLLVPVVAAWLWGLVGMIRKRRDQV
jgi:hypothetical protein